MLKHTAKQPSATKYRFAALGIVIDCPCLNPAKRCFVAEGRIALPFMAWFPADVRRKAKMWKIRSSAANARLSTAKKVKANPWLVAGCTYGPCFLFIGFSRTLADPFKHDLDTLLMFALGAVFLMTGFGMLYVNQQRLERRLDELERVEN